MSLEFETLRPLWPPLGPERPSKSELRMVTPRDAVTDTRSPWSGRRYR